MPRPTSLRPLALAAVAALAVTGCSTGPTGSGGATGDASASSAGAASGDTGTFPVTVEHAFGETTIETDPQRIVTVGWTDHDVVAALGEVPVGAVRITWGGNGAGSTDWFDARLEELGADASQITRYDDSDGLPVDEIAAMEPDLILGTNSGLSQEDFDALSRIAPTVAYPELAWGTPWRESVELVGDAIGRPEQADAAIERTDALFEQARDEHPELEGTTFAWASFTPTDLSTVVLYTPTDLRPQILRELGMEDADVVEELGGDDAAFSVNLSAEQADTLDADVLVFYTFEGLTADTVLADPLLSTIPAMRDGAYVEAAEEQKVMGMSSPTPLSIPVVLEGFVPELAEAAAKAAR